MIIEKIDDFDSAMLGVKVTVIKENGFYGEISTYGNIGRVSLSSAANGINCFISNPTQEYSFELIDGRLGSNSSIIITLFPPDSKGYIRVQIDAEVDVNNQKKENYSLQFLSEWGKVEVFEKKLKSFSEKGGINDIKLN